MEKTNTDPEPKERSLTGDSSKYSRDGSSDGDLPCSEAVQRATAQNHSMSGTCETPQGEHLSSDKDDTGNLVVLANKVGTLDLPPGKRNRSGAAKKRARRARQAGARTGDPACIQPPFEGGQTQTWQKPSTSGLQGKRKRQRTSGSTPEDRQVKGPMSSGQHSYTRVTQEGLRMAIICDGYPKVQVTEDDFEKI
jgi:hypothetical protein